MKVTAKRLRCSTGDGIYNVKITNIRYDELMQIIKSLNGDAECGMVEEALAAQLEEALKPDMYGSEK